MQTRRKNGTTTVRIDDDTITGISFLLGILGLAIPLCAIAGYIISGIGQRSGIKSKFLTAGRVLSFIGLVMLILDIVIAIGLLLYWSC